MRRWALLATSSLAFAAGCQQETGKVLDRLPDPAYTDRQPSPAPRTVPSPRASVPAIPGSENWLPPGGLSDRWQCIVIHHTASRFGSLRDVDRWHRDKGWDGCGYHFVVGNGTHTPDGLVEAGLRWKGQATGAHTRLATTLRSGYENYYNEHGIGIVLVGNFDEDRPTARQVDSLANLVRFLMIACNIPEKRVYIHGDLKATDCPGRRFPRTEFRKRLKGLS